MSELDRFAESPTTVWTNNPALVWLMGLSPLLAVSQTAVVGTALALITLLVCLASALTMYGLRSYIAPRHLYLWIVIILAGYTSLISQLLQIWFYPLYRELGIYTYLVACNFALLVKMPSYQKAAAAPPVLLDACKLGIALGIVLIGFSMLRELLISRAIFANLPLLIPANFDAGAAAMQSDWIKFMALQPGALILLGLVVAICNAVGITKPEAYYHRDEPPIERARVTGRLKSSGQ
jgi:Na+-translocating ferredoxin:NAD+ oxidoreductase RnfE subunit